MPANFAPSGEKPIARKERPNVVRCTSTHTPTATSPKTHACTGSPSANPLPSERNDSGKLVNDFVPPVSASASPRKSEKVPSVTMSGGSDIRVMSTAFSPPPSAPTPIAPSAASHGESSASFQNIPNATAQRPMSEPTERSMPAVRMMGVITSASSPISTDCRTMFATLSPVRNLRPMK